LRDILGDEARVLGLIKEELTEIAERFGDERRTEITASEDELDIEDLIADQQMVITITKSGYIKSLPLATYKEEKATDKKEKKKRVDSEEDEIEIVEEEREDIKPKKEEVKTQNRVSKKKKKKKQGRRR